MTPMRANRIGVIFCLDLFRAYRVANQEQVGEDYEAEGYAVPAEGLEVIFLDVAE